MPAYIVLCFTASALLWLARHELPCQLLEAARGWVLTTGS
jgi:hypothetical protein